MKYKYKQYDDYNTMTRFSSFINRTHFEKYVNIDKKLKIFIDFVYGKYDSDMKFNDYYILKKYTYIEFLKNVAAKAIEWNKLIGIKYEPNDDVINIYINNNEQLKKLNEYDINQRKISFE